MDRLNGTARYKLPPMTLWRTHIMTLVGVAAILGSCRKDDKPVVVDSSATAVAPPQPTAARNPGWNENAAGPMMLLSSTGDLARALVVIPHLTDSSMNGSAEFRLDSLYSMPVDLFGTSGTATSASIVPAGSQRQVTEGCVSWPEVRVAATPSTTWRVGLRKGLASAIRLDSLEKMSPADSTRITSEIARLSAVAAEGDDPAFQGLPFVVRRAYRFNSGPTTIIVGDVVRKINEEANPREEHILLLAERNSGEGAYVTAYHSRVAGSEDAVRTNEILAAINLRNGSPTIVISFDQEEGGRLALLQRVDNKQWRVTWRSAYTGC